MANWESFNQPVTGVFSPLVLYEAGGFLFERYGRSAEHGILKNATDLNIIDTVMFGLVGGHAVVYVILSC